MSPSLYHVLFGDKYIPRTYLRLDFSSREEMKWSPCQDKIRRQETNRKDSFNMNWYRYRLASCSLDLQMFEPGSFAE